MLGVDRNEAHKFYWAATLSDDDIPAVTQICPADHSVLLSSSACLLVAVQR